jgi:hypothetical protein
VNRRYTDGPTRRRFRLRAAAAAAGLAGAVALAGCGSGQISQTSTQASAVDGAQAVINNLALRDVHIDAVQTGDFLGPGDEVDLVLVVTNQSPQLADKLVRVTTDIGPVTVSGNPRLPAGGTLFVGGGAKQHVLDAVQAAQTAKAIVALTKPITNGLTYNFTFDFDRAGSVGVAVPISARPAPRTLAPGR